MFVSAKNTVLFLKRGAASDYAGFWDFPGGGSNDGETPEQTAERETAEEIGFLPEGERRPHTRQRSSTTELAGAGPVDGGPGAPEGSLVPGAPGTVADGSATVRGMLEGALARAGSHSSRADMAVPQHAEPVEFTTFLQRVDREFEPRLNDEHVGYAWCPMDAPPEPVHPGCLVALARPGMDELGVARAIRDGLLASPQRYENVTLFAMRITGTGTAFRHKFNEFVYRRPENYLSQEFLERCGGLPVIIMHPPKDTLDSKEFAKRVVGTIMLAYIKGDEVWGVAKIYDDAAARMMEGEQLSTSPAVVFRDPSVNSKLELEDGSKLLIEGKPSLLDHLAVCEQGVWDKGGEPAGIDSGIHRGDSSMSEAESKKVEQKADDAARKDAEQGEKLDKILCAMDSVTKRMDSFEKRMDEDDKRKADAARKDEDDDKKKADAKRKADEDEDEKEKAERVAADARKKADEDAARKDAKRKDEDEKKEEVEKKADSVAPLQARIEEVAAMIPKALTDADYHAMADAQARADTVFAAFGDHAPRPLQGEDLNSYRRRLATKMKDHSNTWKGVDLLKIADDTAFSIAETQIYADAMSSAHNPVDLPPDVLRAITARDTTGRQITTFAGKPSAWMGQFGGVRRRLSGIRNQSY